jgi:chromosome segregation ATPase
MAPGGKKAQRHGWRHQAERLALNHTAVSTATWAAAEQTRRRPLVEPVSCHLSVSPAKSERDQEASTNVEQQVAREAAAAWILNARREILATRAARAKVADERAAELEAKLDTALERIAFQDNENQSLRTSLELIARENLRLSNHLSESNATLEEISSPLEQLKTMEAERDRLTYEADKKIEFLQNLLQVKARRAQKLEQARSKLIDDTKTLLRTCAKRDRALARAEERISSLTDLFAQLETKVEHGKMASTNVDLWQSELNRDEWLFGLRRG